jgi:hypothetical protein
MGAFVGLVFPGFGLFAASLLLTLASLWIGERLAPWFLRDSYDPPSVRSYFLDPGADMEMSRGRIVSVLIATAIMLAVLLAMAIAVKFGGIALD